MSALSGYRRLLRSINFAFYGDIQAIKAAKLQIHEEFAKNRIIKDTQNLSELMNSINEVDEMLRFHIVQGKLNKRGNFDVALQESHIVTVESNQDDPHGPALEPVDRSILGSSTDVKIEFSSKKK